MTAEQIVQEIRQLGTEGYRKVLRNHGVPEPLFGVKISEMKKIQQRVKKDYRLALDLFDTGIYDAMYLAGLIADDPKMTKEDLHNWVEKSRCGAISSCTVPWVAAGSNFGRELAIEWIDSRTELVAISGWATLTSLVSIKPDAELDLSELERLLERVQKTIRQAPNDLRYAMNSFVIGVGCYVLPLTDTAMEVAGKLGRVTVDMGNTSCQVPYAPDYIQKVRDRGSLGKKRKTAKC